MNIELRTMSWYKVNKKRKYKISIFCGTIMDVIDCDSREKVTSSYESNKHEIQI